MSESEGDGRSLAEGWASALRMEYRLASCEGVARQVMAKIDAMRRRSQTFNDAWQRTGPVPEAERRDSPHPGAKSKGPHQRSRHDQ